MTYIVSGGALNSTLSLAHFTHATCVTVSRRYQCYSARPPVWRWCHLKWCHIGSTSLNTINSLTAYQSTSCLNRLPPRISPCRNVNISPRNFPRRVHIPDVFPPTYGNVDTNILRLRRQSLCSSLFRITLEVVCLLFYWKFYMPMPWKLEIGWTPEALSFHHERRRRTRSR